ncbi:DUF2851 family protein [uncultured Psychroserpens sp.]|uniref:DUF2851 family protein n=1 Tax=uncultured Psychroserpens sp. TaxID=255436 RepID=UPI00261AFDA5|nr:DUF2851 family protein [uncultured Psychroserpens sp.]
MKEEFLHYIWQYKKFKILQLKTTQHEPLEIISGGMSNFHSGPDFFNGQLRIGGQLWAGNIEIHIKSSDWYLHNHEQDPAYDNVILHVVYVHDIEIFRKDNSVIPTLELRHYIDKDILKNYKALCSSKHKWINCEEHFAEVPKFSMSNWLERLYFERLEEKAIIIENLLKQSNNDWEAVLCKLLAKSFGSKVNGEALFQLVHSIDFSLIRKMQSSIFSLEALFFGQAKLLDKVSNETYYCKLQKEYQFLKQKFKLDHEGLIALRFFRLRPPNFPTIRLSQLANLYNKQPNLFSKLMEINSLKGFYELLEVTTSEFWNDHYTFDKTSKHSVKKVSKPFIDLLLINTILPLKFCYVRQHKIDAKHSILEVITTIASEKNTIITGFNRLRPISVSAMQSQALIQLKTEYCDKNKCLNCVVGNTLLSK